MILLIKIPYPFNNKIKRWKMMISRYTFKHKDYYRKN